MPERGWPAGYAALIDHGDLQIPLPPKLTMIAERHEPDSTGAWNVLPRRLKPDDTVEAHLEFALKYEGIDLAVWNALFKTVGADTLIPFISATPTGRYARRLWFLYEWLTGNRLGIPDIGGRPSAVDAVDPSQQVALGKGAVSKRHAVRNNLLGTPAFCPMIRWTDELRDAARAGLETKAREVIGRTHPDVVSRAAAFLLLDDSRSSFAIEGERPSYDRARRWGQAIAEAGSRDLSIDELVRLQHVVIGDQRFVELDLRTEGGFVGDRDRHTREPLIRHISARPGDLQDLLKGIIAFDERAARCDPVVVAAAIAFGFVYVHPFQDGNGRIHRWLIHHVLAKAGFNPPQLPFPVSAAILRNVDTYKKVLESYSLPLLDVIEYEITDRKNVRVTKETADYYRFFDATAHAEFLYRCVAETVEKDLPGEVAYLEAFDRFAERVQQIVDMPYDTIDLLHRFLAQSGGRLSQRARAREFSALTEEEAAVIEEAYREAHATETDREAS